MTMVTRTFTSLTAAVLVTAFSGGLVLAAQPATKDQAGAMVKKAVAYIKAEGPHKAYPAIDDHSGQFATTTCMSWCMDSTAKHGADKTRIGNNQMGDKDPDGKAFVKERI